MRRVFPTGQGSKRDNSVGREAIGSDPFTHGNMMDAEMVGNNMRTPGVGNSLFNEGIDGCHGLGPEMLINKGNTLEMISGNSLQVNDRLCLMHIGQRIRERRKALGLSQAVLGEYFNISSVSVSEWERMISKPDQDKLPKLARLLKTTVSSLLDTSDRPTVVTDVQVDPISYGKHTSFFGRPQDLRVEEPQAAYGSGAFGNLRRLPLISEVQAGGWADIVDNFQPGDAEDWIPCPFTCGPNSFILKVSGYSMYNPSGDKSYSPGEFIAVDPSREAQNKQMIVARVDHEERATFKQLLIDADGNMLLQALNPTHSPRVMTMPEGSSIVGVVIGKWTPE